MPAPVGQRRSAGHGRPAAPARHASGHGRRTTVPRERITVTTDLLRLVFDTEGGSLVRTEFLKHADLNDKSATFVLLDDSPPASICGPDGP